MSVRARARWIAAAIVVGLAAFAHAALTINDNPATNQIAPSNVPINIVVSIRNTSAMQLSIVSIGKSNPGCPTDVTIAKSGGGLIGQSLDPNQQVQYVVSAPNGVTSNQTCIWDVAMNAPNPVEQFTTTFRTTGMASGAPADAQPLELDFGAPSTFEIQDILLTSYSPTTLAAVVATISGTGDVRFFGQCDGQQSCALGDIPARGTVSLKAKCQRTMPGIATGMIEYKRGTQTIATQQFACSQGMSMNVAQIVIVDPAPILIQGPQGQPTTRNVSIGNTGMTDNSLTNAALSGASNITFDAAFCMTTSCTFPPGSKPIPLTIPVVCTPSSTPSSSTLSVQGSNGSTDVDTATVQCSASSGGPQISVSPANVQAPDTDVGTTSPPQLVTVTNNGTAQLDFSIDVEGFDTDWIVGACLAPASCPVAPSATRMIEVRFAPTEHGLRPATLEVSSNAGDRTVTLGGKGLGGVLEVVTPATNAIDFGVIARDQEDREVVELANVGNVPIIVDIGMPGVPFGVSSATVSIGAGATEQFDVVCRSAAPGGPFTDAVSLSSLDVYRQETSAIAVACEIANTNLLVTPELAFGEIRKGTPAEPIEITLTNPGGPQSPGSVTVEEIRLGSIPTGLSLDAPPTPITIAAGNSAPGGTLSLATTTNVDLAGSDLLVTVDGETLRLPITGKVVTASAYVAPDELDLGTACVGTPVSGTVMMINNGTATLVMQAPTLDRAFTLLPVPSDFPKELRPGRPELVAVSPTTSTVGRVDGVLEWDVDIETAPFRIPIRLQYIDAGTGISPGALAFGTIEIETTSFVQTVTLENCNTAPVLVTIAGLRKSAGEVSAWNVQPELDQRELGPHDKMTISVAFAPSRPGRHVAYLQLAVDGVASEIELAADAVGFFQEPTSFYACGCAGSQPGGSSNGWMIGMAIAIVVHRRRRHPSS